MSDQFFGPFLAISEVGSPDYIAKSVIFKFCMARGCRDKFHVWNWKPEKRLLVVFKFLVARCGLLCLHVYIGLCFEPLICRCLVCFFCALAKCFLCFEAVSLVYLVFVLCFEPLICRCLFCLCYPWTFHIQDFVVFMLCFEPLTVNCLLCFEAVTVRYFLCFCCVLKLSQSGGVAGKGRCCHLAWPTHCLASFCLCSQNPQNPKTKTTTALIYLITEAFMKGRVRYLRHKMYDATVLHHVF